ncbi:hypothetical protein S245_020696, partial [Arachis hypogaea]
KDAPPSPRVVATIGKQHCHRRSSSLLLLESPWSLHCATAVGVPCHQSEVIAITVAEVHRAKEIPSGRIAVVLSGYFANSPPVPLTYLMSLTSVLEQVTSCKLWRQVGESFKPPKTCTTVSWTFPGFYEK